LQSQTIEIDSNSSELTLVNYGGHLIEVQKNLLTGIGLLMEGLDYVVRNAKGVTLIRRNFEDEVKVLGFARRNGDLLGLRAVCFVPSANGVLARR
jgi:hypothetical protein